MAPDIRSWIRKKIPKSSFFGCSLHFFYNLILGNYFLDLAARYRRHLQAKNILIYGPEILRTTVGVCDELGMRPFLVRGTLLGYFRHQSLIPGDYDFDFGLLPDDFGKIGSLKKKMLERGFKVRSDNRYKNVLQKVGEIFLVQITHRRSGVWVDFNLFYRVNDKICYVEDRRLEYLYQGKEIENVRALGPEVVGYALAYEPQVFSKFKKVSFLQSDVWVPEAAEKYLEATYGDWRLEKKKAESFYHNLNTVRYDKAKDSFELVPVRAGFEAKVL